MEIVTLVSLTNSSGRPLKIGSVGTWLPSVARKMIAAGEAALFNPALHGSFRRGDWVDLSAMKAASETKKTKAK